MEIQIGIPSEEWNERLKKLNGHFLQSNFWANFQNQYGRKTYYSFTDDWMWLGLKQSSRGIKYLYLPYGPTCISDESFTASIENIKEFATKNKFDFVRIEPNAPITTELIRNKAVPIKEVQPTYTNVLDLSLSETDLFNNLSSGHRHAIRHAEDRKIRVQKCENTEEIKDFLLMHHETINRAGIKTFPDEYYETLAQTLLPSGSARLFFAYCDNQKVASAIVFDFNNTRYYAFAAAYQELNRKVQGAVVLVWELILDAKKNGLLNFDFWGVASANQPNHPWAGLSYFKRAFGGHDKKYLGTWDLVINRFKYKIYSNIKRIKR